ncbi:MULTISPECIES: MerR family transcriptional regulator [Desulfitobacterium]|uniref:Putative transcriptional regulator n=1 Tax=Desulfitobacterium dehalogenans (strain ATCC 51507 / DSM 9161 / JW/IU-DC1) TaxID=756499 RepID=I4ACH1_DESDJ|nr:MULTISPECIES: MerR family transcriptional regulator [Desulfitobacterium]AFM01656.1 putative transcriptional regulator [Desulfitobacterium dehalogenans ATCC 51507]
MKVTIRKFADCIGVTPETIRHYREIGLLNPKVRENGYYDYTVNDALTALLTREMRTYGMQLESIRDSYDSIGEYNKLLADREAELKRDMEMIRLELSRMHETRIYASCGVRILNKVEEFEGPPTWAVATINRKEGFLPNRGMEQWVKQFPFTYVSATIPLEELNSRKGLDLYDIQIGLGALIHYVEKFQLPLGGRSYYQPGGRFIRTCITTRDLFSLSPQDISPLLEYAEAQGYVFASCTGGRLLYIDRTEKGPLFYLLVWVRVDPKSNPLAEAGKLEETLAQA